MIKIFNFLLNLRKNKKETLVKETKKTDYEMIEICKNNLRKYEVEIKEDYIIGIESAKSTIKYLYKYICKHLKIKINKIEITEFQRCLIEENDGKLDHYDVRIEILIYSDNIIFGDRMYKTFYEKIKTEQIIKNLNDNYKYYKEEMLNSNKNWFELNNR